jgi:hypothetical protein
MQPWEIIKKRAIETLVIWKQHQPDLRVNNQGHLELDTLIHQFEPLAQQCVLTQHQQDDAERAAQASLEKLKLLGTHVPHIIEGQLYDNAPLITALKKVFQSRPRTVAGILARMRDLYPLWLMADQALAAFTPPHPPIARRLQEIPHSAAMAKELLDGYNEQINQAGQARKANNVQKAAMQAHARRVDKLNKNWYKIVSNSFEAGTAGQEALRKIPTEKGTLVPAVLEIKSLKQGGGQGLHIIIRYAPKGGERSTRRRLRWQILGQEEDYAHEQPLDRQGNTLGPFEPGTTLQIVAEVANSAGTRTSAPRTITIEPPIR